MTTFSINLSTIMHAAVDMLSLGRFSSPKASGSFKCSPFKASVADFVPVPVAATGTVDFALKRALAAAARRRALSTLGSTTASSPDEALPSSPRAWLKIEPLVLWRSAARSRSSFFAAYAFVAYSR